MYEYITPEEGMSYKEYIEKILNDRPNERASDGYQEKHHIVPKCLGGTNDDENLIWLYAEEHYYAHKLLALENPNNEKLQYPWWMLSTRNQEKISAEEYAAARANVAKTMSDNHKGENNPMYGKTMSEENRKVSSERMKKRTGENNPNYGKRLSKEERKKVSDGLKGKYVGENNHMYGKHLSEETKKKIGDSERGSKNYRARKVVCIETKKIYGSMQEAAIDMGFANSSHISDCCRGTRHMAGGYHWQYYEDYIKKQEEDNNGSNNSKS